MILRIFINHLYGIENKPWFNCIGGGKRHPSPPPPPTSTPVVCLGGGGGMCVFVRVSLCVFVQEVLVLSDCDSPPPPSPPRNRFTPLLFVIIHLMIQYNCRIHYGNARSRSHRLLSFSSFRSVLFNSFHIQFSSIHFIPIQLILFHFIPIHLISFNFITIQFTSFKSILFIPGMKRIDLNEV